MSIPLVDALRMVDLKPGRVYRERVNGLRVEVTVSLAGLPEADAAHIATATEGKRMLPCPFHRDESDGSAK